MNAFSLRTLFPLLPAMALAWPLPVLADQALVRSYDNPRLSVGQAYLARYDEACIAMLPLHVAREAGVPAYLGERRALLGESDEIDDLGDDIAVAEVSGTLSQTCGTSIGTLSRAVDNRIHRQGLATLRSVNSDGSLANIAVTVVDNDGERYLRIRPTNDKVQIRKGHSGSLVLVDGHAVGMLLSVHARHGVGKVLRFDRLLERIEQHLAQRSDAENGPARGPSNASQDLAARVSGGSVSGWDSVAVDAEHRPRNLIEEDTITYWRASVSRWPTELEFDLAGDKTVITRIVLDGSGVSSVDELPQRIEILASTPRDARRWRSLLSREVSFDAEGRAVFQVAPTWARHVRLVFAASRAQGDKLSLSRVHIYGR